MEDKLQYLPASNSPCAELGCCTPYVFTFAAVRADISFDLQETAPEMTPLKSKEKKLFAQVFCWSCCLLALLRSFFLCQFVRIGGTVLPDSSLCVDSSPSTLWKGRDYQYTRSNMTCDES
ncbi:uncharacterized protein LOC143764254 isoform X1 [Ranitomeya variabilis]|uniref:uncharacterized protein LOC143764254 isoform X1 n=1 Tax=Ranitomeya variabilis TaxID=490064 RepID=UPI00405610B1